MKKLSLFSALGVSTLTLGAILASGLSTAEETEKSVDIDAAPAEQSLVVAELFTSQSCSSCPPAEALFSELADQDDVLTIEWHVDYWDDLIHGGSNWKDPYSNPVYTERQRSYNASLRRTRAVYTPQAIVNGVSEGVGNRGRDVSSMIRTAENLTVPVTIKGETIEVGASASTADIIFLRLLKNHETNVKGGENKGRKLFGKNIVLEASLLGKTSGQTSQFERPEIGNNESCAVLIQSLSGDVGPVLGAAKC